MSTQTERENVTETGIHGPTSSRFDVLREGAALDDIEIVHYEPQFAVPGGKTERRVVRTIAGFFLLTGLAATVFLVAYIWWPWEFGRQDGAQWFTPILGASLGLALAGLAFGILTWGKKLLPREVSIQQRHTGGSSEQERRITGQTIAYLGEEMGIGRRPLLKFALPLGLAPVGLVAAAPLIGGLIEDPHKNQIPGTETPELYTTGWNPAYNGGKPVRLTRQDGTPIRPEDVSVGGQMTVFPGIPHGSSNEHADSPTLLIHLRTSDADQARAANHRAGREDWMYGDYIAYSKICTHAGCPASLYEQQTNRLLCPCHQSQFLITDNAAPIFGPASRPLPQLEITVDDEGFFVAKRDYTDVIGPDFWERP
ncbi:cytochrome bc1 complex Rieske iron-sulfur subunit [Rhizomonospora bruguierae]|uniref:cytochrome bc1 complex Rieske iron-sulfur subunit n=1 Tax=Rhizomonospora bruguierae TaxID=1581705 RepID=UPI001BCAEB1D|nr:Rieske 2Fe-2S domain-containing protein [Micromonospora sp. NBRC 107566]